MSKEWNDDWRDELKEKNSNCHLRLCECRNTSKDLKIIAKLMYKYNQWATPEQCADRTLEWITCWNSQVNLIPVDEEYTQLINYITGK